MPSWLQGFLLGLLVIAILAGLLIGTVWLANECVLAFNAAVNTMPQEGTLEFRYIDGGYLYFTWPESDRCDGYLLQFLVTEDDGSQRVIYSEKVTDRNYYILQGVPFWKDLTIRIQSYTYYTFPFQDYGRIRYGEEAIEITGTFQAPTVDDLTWTADPNTDRVQVFFSTGADTVVRMYREEADGTLTLVEELSENFLTLTFGDGDGADYPIPSFEETVTFVFDAYVRQEGFLYYGITSNEFSLVREDFLGTELYLQCTDEGHNDFTFTWNETKGEYYEVQRYDLDLGQWITVHTVPRDGDRTYYTGHLPRYSQFLYRVVALGGQTMPDSEFAATPAEVMVQTQASLIYSTVWPIQELDVYATPGGNSVVGKLPEGTACCVLDEEDGMFYVRFDNGYGYIDSNYCMINLPEFIGDICLYDITNSYDSLYKVHEFEIPTVTGTVITGYEKVELNEGEYLVPLMYPTALKLEKAAFAAIEQGYKIKIYDSYRPKKATLELYSIATKLLDDPIPDEIYCTEEDRKDLKRDDAEDTLLWYNFLADLEIPEELIQAFEAEENPEETPAEGETTEPTETLEDYRPTYEELMTDNGRYRLDYFLALGGSRHNQGVAMDMTLVDLYTGKELEMQTAMHDLSWYSEIELNNSAAKKLRALMFDQGFTGLVSEWWHFQDDETRLALDLPYMSGGISPECWMADDNGWRYRRANGQYITSCTETINGVSYVFNAEGYAQKAHADNG